MASGLVPGCFVMSDLLTIREKGILSTLLEPHCKLLKTTVAQLLKSSDTDGEAAGWCSLGCGVMCLIEDESVHSYFLRLYCVKSATLIWEQEMYIPFQYNTTRRFFHTFPADDHQIGFNFANESEAEEFHLTVEAVQREQEKMTDLIEMISTETVDSSVHDPPDTREKPVVHLHSKRHLTLDTSPMAVTGGVSSDLNHAMRRLSMQENLQRDDPKDNDDDQSDQSVDDIISKFGGRKAMQRDLWKKGTVSHTLPKAAGASISLALRKGPLPAIPCIRVTSQQTPQDSQSENQREIPPPPSHPPPALVPEKIRKTASFKYY